MVSGEVALKEVGRQPIKKGMKERKRMRDSGKAVLTEEGSVMTFSSQVRKEVNRQAGRKTAFR
eukprot:245357-Pelagomonas_calceolata.AAC.2